MAPLEHDVGNARTRELVADREAGLAGANDHDVDPVGHPTRPQHCRSGRTSSTVPAYCASADGVAADVRGKEAGPIGKVGGLWWGSVVLVGARFP